MNLPGNTMDIQTTVLMDNIDRKLLNELQADLPLVAVPFAELGRRLGIGEDDVISRTRRLKAAGIIRSIGPIINYRAIGYRSTLVAMRLSVSRIAKAADAVSRHSGVSHNYQRDDEFNLWFTLTAPDKSELDKGLRLLIDELKPLQVLDLPALRVFKMSALFDMTGNGWGTERIHRFGDSDRAQTPQSLTDSERSLIAVIQQDLQLTARPFDVMAQHLGLETERFLIAYRDLVQRGVVRRIGASLSHTRAGFVANAMVCWQVPADAIERVADIMCSYSQVSHCYERRPAAGWPYNLFTMLHSTSRDELNHIIEDMRQATGIHEYKSLMTVKEFKKERLKLEV